MAAFWGAISALAKLLAKLLMSTPDPLPRLVIRACAAALAELVVFDALEVVPVVEEVDGVVVDVVAVVPAALGVDEETDVTTCIALLSQCIDRWG